MKPPLPTQARRWRVACLAACLLAVLPGMGRAQIEEQAPEQQVKAAFLYRFAGYVEWPEGALGGSEAPFTIAVLGADALAAELTQIVNGRRVGNHPMAVRRLRPGDALADAAMLFVGKGEMGRWKQMLAAGPPRPLLIVTESEGALAAGSMVNFLLIERRVRFEISLEAAEKHGLKLSSRLLSVAVKVQAGGD